MNHARLLARFLRYVAVDTTADPESSTYPSSPGQLVLGEMLVQEVRNIGLVDVVQDHHGIVLATIPAHPSSPRGHQRLPVVALCAHLDTSPETPGANIRP